MAWRLKLFLIDTNIWLEQLLNQERSLEVTEFLSIVPSNYLYITDFSFHSIGVIASRLNRIDIFRKFVHDTFIDGSVGLMTLLPSHMENLLTYMEIYQLDFDDAYQLTVMKDYGLILVSFDHDFDRTTEGRITPADALQVFHTKMNGKLS